MSSPNLSSPATAATNDDQPHGMTTVDEVDAFTRLFLLCIFLTLFIRVCYVYFTSYRFQNLGNTSTRHFNEKKAPTGLHIDAINSYQTFPYAKDNVVMTITNDHDTVCSICISDYVESEILRIMPQCRHYFHRDCVDQWLKVNGSCPICRSSLILQGSSNGSSNLESV